MFRCQSYFSNRMCRKEISYIFEQYGIWAKAANLIIGLACVCVLTKLTDFDNSMTLFQLHDVT
jgi:uncharacterized membrane protein YuzA (DUF378 family)